MFRGVLPEPAAAGGGDVVVSAAGVDGRLDVSLTALWSKEEFSENILLLFCGISRIFRETLGSRHTFPFLNYFYLFHIE